MVPGTDPYDALVDTASKLKASRLVTGVSTHMDPAELAHRIGRAWEKSPEPRHAFSLETLSPGRPSSYVNLGPHPPRLWPEDVEQLHEIWLQVSEKLGSELHHRDVVGVALHRLRRDLDGEPNPDIIEDFRGEMALTALHHPKGLPDVLDEAPSPD